MRRHLIAATAALAALAAATPAAAAPQPYRANDFGGVRDVLPPGPNGFTNAVQLAAFLSTGARPPHNNDQLATYGDLVYASPGLKAADIPKYFKEASFGVAPDDVERTYSPRSDVTLVRDKSTGVPHIYGDTRQGAMFGAGFVAAEDRLFFIDVLRNLGRAQVSSFAGGSEGNRSFDRTQWALAPYTEADLQRQLDQLDDLYGAEGAKIQSDVANYVDGINKYIAEAKLDPTKLPGEYFAINRPLGPDEWKATDVIATAALVGGIFGKGGGREIDSVGVLQAAQKRFGGSRGTNVWRDFRSAEDPEAPTTVKDKRFTYGATPRKPAAGSVAIPDPGSVKKEPASSAGGGSSSAGGPCVAGALLCLPKANSNALLVSAKESKSGKPLAVFGPQTGYFSPQILMEMDIHAPDIDARGAAFPGVNLYVQLGRGRDYAWSATSAGQDIVDTFALDLCNADGSAPSLSSTHYVYRGNCRPIEVLERTNTWTPSPADQTPPGSETLRTGRTALGLISHRATLRGKPVIYTKLRSTYLHEIDSARGFVDFNDPAKIRNAADYQRAAHKIGYTFNWLYTDDRDIAYFNSGANPVRAAGSDPNLPIRGDFEWRGFNADANTSQQTPFSQHPQVTNQSYLTSWNNKQAPGTRAADSNFGFTSVYRSLPLDDGIKSRTAGTRKIDLPGLIDAAESAGTVDLRGYKVLPVLLRVLRAQPAPPRPRARRAPGRKRGPRFTGKADTALGDAIAKLEAWRRDGAHRRDRNRDGRYEHADAIRIMDAWWPRLIEAEFKPALGDELYKQIQELIELDNSPNNRGEHLGSAYQNGWYGYAHKDLRTLLAPKKVKGRYSRVYCGNGDLAACQRALMSSLKAAVAIPAGELYGDDKICNSSQGEGLDPQWCFDAVSHRPLGGVTQPLIHWINRPTYQIVAEIPGHRPR